MSLESTVISLVPFDIIEEKPGLIPPRFYIPASDMKIPKLLKVGTAAHYVYLDESRGSLRVRNPSDIIAKSIVEDYCNSQLGIDDESGPALFWRDKDMSIIDVANECKAELLEYLIRQKRWFLNIAQIAENDWTRYHQHNVISSFQRRAAEIIGWTSQQHEWMSPITTMRSSPCPACGFAVPEGVVLCNNCKCVIDPHKYEKLQFAH